MKKMSTADMGIDEVAISLKVIIPKDRYSERSLFQNFRK